MGFRMYVPTRIIFGAGSLNKLSRQKLPGKKALVVISNGKSTRANGYLDRTLEALQQAGAETVVFDQVMANPLKSTVMAGGAFAREQGCDFIVALGGGSVIDASKAIAIVATNDGTMFTAAQAAVSASAQTRFRCSPSRQPQAPAVKWTHSA